MHHLCPNLSTDQFLTASDRKPRWWKRRNLESYWSRNGAQMVSEGTQEAILCWRLAKEVSWGSNWSGGGRRRKTERIGYSWPYDLVGFCALRENINFAPKNVKLNIFLRLRINRDSNKYYHCQMGKKMSQIPYHHKIETVKGVIIFLCTLNILHLNSE